MIRKSFVAGYFFILLFLVSCSSDDNNTSSLSIEEQNTADDTAIINFLNSYYFDDLGKVTKFSDAVTPQDKEPLSKNAKKSSLGYWIVTNPNADKGINDSLTADGKNNILIHYSLKYFIASEGGNGYSTLYTSSSSIDNSGIAQEDPFFYKKPKNDTIKSENYYVIKGIVDGLKDFKPTNKSINDLYNVLQGVIIVPSRLAYGREENYTNSKNATFILNFELYKVCPKDQSCN
ncbi:hypothetical protein [uncultured Apibacter sp.]|uniref:hypothetical protein n=1 Tax=uncultured Apibacter sp. TaxID=1778616 RepID=UPI0025ED9022|nr:hypothetical protein [uncultured Apibacter sp.]